MKNYKQKIVSFLLIAVFLISPLSTNAALLDNIQGEWYLSDGDFTDQTANNNDMTTVGSPVAADGFTGYPDSATDFEQGTPDYLKITDAAQTGLDITGDLTVAAWIKIETASKLNMLVTKWEASNQSFRFYIGSDNKIYFAISSDGTENVWTNSDLTLSAGVWTHVMAIYDGTDIRVYKDNVQTGTPTSHTTGIYNGNGEFRIGHGTTAGREFDGVISDVGVWSKALTSGERAELYALAENFGSADTSMINAVVRDSNGDAVNCTAFNTRVIVYTTAGVFVSTELVTISDGTYSIDTGLFDTKFLVINLYEGATTDSIGAAIVPAS